MILTVFGGIAEFERSLIRERTGAGRKAAMSRGVKFGRPPKLSADQMALLPALPKRARQHARSPKPSAYTKPPFTGALGLVSLLLGPQPHFTESEALPPPRGGNVCDKHYHIFEGLARKNRNRTAPP